MVHKQNSDKKLLDPIEEKKDDPDQNGSQDDDHSGLVIGKDSANLSNHKSSNS